jgi:hypothetical protein
MKARRANSNERPERKGFTIHVGNDYLGYIHLNDDNVDEAVLEQLLNPANFKLVIAGAELRAFKKKEVNQLSDVTALLAGLQEEKASEDVPFEVDEE